MSGFFGNNTVKLLDLVEVPAGEYLSDNAHNHYGTGALICLTMVKGQNANGTTLLVQGKVPCTEVYCDVMSCAQLVNPAGDVPGVTTLAIHPGIADQDQKSLNWMLPPDWRVKLTIAAASAPFTGIVSAVIVL